MSTEPVFFEDLLGKTLVSATDIKGRSQLVFVTDDGWKLEQQHWQDCCEDVKIETIDGNLSDLVGTPILLAEKVSQRNLQLPDGLGRWTFYKLATIKGYVTIRWYGESNGYYSVEVSDNWSKV